MASSDLVATGEAVDRSGDVSSPASSRVVSSGFASSVSVFARSKPRPQAKRGRAGAADGVSGLCNTGVASSTDGGAIGRAIVGKLAGGSGAELACSVELPTDDITSCDCCRTNSNVFTKAAGGAKSVSSDKSGSTFVSRWGCVFGSAFVTTAGVNGAGKRVGVGTLVCLTGTIGGGTIKGGRSGFDVWRIIGGAVNEAGARVGVGVGVGVGTGIGWLNVDGSEIGKRISGGFLHRSTGGVAAGKTLGWLSSSRRAGGEENRSVGG